jgi:hypothetical protein
LRDGLTTDPPAKGHGELGPLLHVHYRRA